MVKPIPEGFHAVTASLTLKDTKKALEFYQKAFGAKVIDTFPTFDGKGLMHAVMQIGDSLLMMGDEMGPDGPKSAETVGLSPMSLYLYVTDVDTVYTQALAAGAKQIFPVAEMFWGDRCGNLLDPFGYNWMIATHTRDLTKEQVNAEAKAFFEQMAKSK